MDLINIENRKGNLVVSSREVAKNFDKEHKHVIRDIANIQTDGVAQNWADLFIETEYQHEQNKQFYREYLLTRDGFSLLAMGFTGKKALEWKLKYIEVFSKMEQELREPRKLSAMEQLKLQYEVIGDHDERLTHLENNMTIDYGQQQQLQNTAKSKVIKALGGINSNAYKERSVRGKVFSAIWKDYKDYFMLGSYKDTARVNFDKALDFFNDWTVPGRVLREIEDCNKQMSL
ncbi:MAG TPA: phage antirepressor Ant [Clostridiales bacterium]|nr:phage antirepressor Ant [Clostridiales bacterium]